MTTARAGKEGIIQVFSFGFGRILAYIFLGGVAGLTGYLLEELVSQRLIGIFVVFLGVFILLGHFFVLRKPSSCPSFLAKAKGRQLSLTTGLVIGLGPCPPLLALLGLAAVEKSFLMGAGMGLVFGLGSLVTPLIILGFLAAKLAALEEFKNIVPFISGLFLIVFGLILLSQ
jgi:sulfite exporter TauE/SafE